MVGLPAHSCLTSSYLMLNATASTLAIHFLVKQIYFLKMPYTCHQVILIIVCFKCANSANYLSVGNNRTLELERNHHQLFNQDLQDFKEFSCDYGQGGALSLCKWTTPSNEHHLVRWKAGQGALSHWSGGPAIDHTLKDATGGYAYFETSFNKKRLNPPATNRGLESMSWWFGNMTRKGDSGEQRLIISHLLNKLHEIKQIVGDKFESPPKLLQTVSNAMPNMPTMLVRDRTIPRTALMLSPTMPAPNLRVSAFNSTTQCMACRPTN